MKPVESDAKWQLLLIGAILSQLDQKKMARLSETQFLFLYFSEAVWIQSDALVNSFFHFLL